MNADEIRRKHNTMSYRKQSEKQQVNSSAHNIARTDEERSSEKTILVQQVPNGTIRLFKTNDEVDSYNSLALSHNQNPEYISIAEDRAEGDVSTDVKNYALKLVSNLHSTKTLGLPSKLSLKEGSIYMMTVNVDVEDGLFNGANGILRKIECIFEKPVRLWIEFFDSNVGLSTRRKMKYYSYKENWTPIEMVSKDIAPMRNQNVRIRRIQFPILPAEAITIIKSQGQSFDSVVVKLTKRMLRSEYYVALSRARTAKGLYIDGYFEEPLETPTVLLVENELSRLRTSAVLIFKYPFLSNYEATGITIVYHNVQSLVKHYDDINCDQNYTCADIMLFVECWTESFEQFKFTGFQLLHSIYSSSSKSSGIVGYSKVKANLLFEYKKSTGKSYFESFCFELKDVSVILLYNSPQSTINELLKNLDEIIGKFGNKKLAILGDFNVDARKVNGYALINHMLKNHLVLQSNGITTNGNTSIDLVFIRGFSLDINIYDSYFSHHKSLWFELI